MIAKSSKGILHMKYPERARHILKFSRVISAERAELGVGLTMTYT